MYVSVTTSGSATARPAVSISPNRRGTIGAKKLISEPVRLPKYGPAADMIISLNSTSEPTRMRCWRSACSGCACAVPCAGFRMPKIAPVTVSMIAVEMISSISE